MGLQLAKSTVYGKASGNLRIAITDYKYQPDHENALQRALFVHAVQNTQSKTFKRLNSKDNTGWWRIRDLNPGPTDYDSAALTTELIRHT